MHMLADGSIGGRPGLSGVPCHSVTSHPDAPGAVGIVTDPPSRQKHAATSDRRLRIRAFRRAVLNFHRRCGRQFPWRDTSEPYAVLIGEILLQRTRAEHAPDTYNRFLSLWPTPEALSTAPTCHIEEVIAPLGLRKRAALLRELGRQLTRLGRVPLKPQALMALPGVGPYTAHAVPILARKRKLPLVDWVIARVLRRYFGIGGTRRPNADRDLWALAETVVESGRGARGMAGYARPGSCGVQGETAVWGMPAQRHLQVHSGEAAVKC